MHPSESEKLQGDPVIVGPTVVRDLPPEARPRFSQ